MVANTLITASRYNIIQDKVNLVLGTGTNDFGYGQAVTSTQVSASNTVNATHMNNLKTDLIKAYVHQTGSMPVLTTVVASNDITDAVYVEYEGVGNTIYSDRHDIYEATQASVESKLSATRSSSWGGGGQSQSVFHEFSVTFTNANTRRNFFNAGGEVRFAATLTGGSGSKYIDWNAMLSAMGTVKFRYTDVSATSGTPGNIGNLDLTSSYQQVYVKSGSGVYAANDVTIYAKGEQSSSVITFKVEFNDGATGSGAGGFTPTDDPVSGTLTSSISQLRPTGSYVELATPAYANIQSLT